MSSRFKMMGKVRRRGPSNITTTYLEEPPRPPTNTAHDDDDHSSGKHDDDDKGDEKDVDRLWVNVDVGGDEGQ